jgi:twinkle protein
MTTERNFYDLQQIKEAMPSRIDEFVMRFFPEAKKENQCYKVGSIDGEKGGSFMISTRSNTSGYYEDYADPSTKGGPWRLASIKNNTSLREGIDWLAKFLGVPPIQTFGAISKAKAPEELSKHLQPLNEKSLEYAKSRKISEETLRKYGVGCDLRNGLSFPYYDAYGDLGMVKHWGFEAKENGKKNIWVSPSEDAVHCLFGKDVCDPESGLDRLVICEGEMDALACFEMGIPAVSIPMGVSNMNWIKEDYEYLSFFNEIVILFDNDEPGKNAAKEVVSRLGEERCLVVKLPLKDANDMLIKNRGKEIAKCIEETSKEPIAEIVDPSSMKEGVRSYMKGDHITEGDPFFLPNYDLSFRKHEMTLWFGYTFAGKSTAVQQQVAFLASRGKTTCVASFEQQPELTFAQILTAYSAYPNLPFTDEFDPAYEHLSKLVFMYKSMRKANTEHLINTFTHAHKRYGVDNFVVDNVMTMNVDRGDNSAQADAADLLRMFVSRHPVHLHVVAHPRKPSEDNTAPASISAIRGASEWGDIPQNIITVWRDMKKSEQMGEMAASKEYTNADIREYFKTTPCAKIITKKQRTTGKTPTQSAYFHDECKQFVIGANEEPSPMYETKPW